MLEFENLYKTYYQQVYKYMLRLCMNEDIAEEITQETFFKALKNQSSFKGECKFSVWLCQIAKNTYLSYLQKSKKLSKSELNETIEADYNIEEFFLDKDMVRKIHQILHEMDEPYKEVFWMRTFGELSFREIAIYHNKTESWARVTYHRAKMKIKEDLL